MSISASLLGIMMKALYHPMVFIPIIFCLLVGIWLMVSGKAKFRMNETTIEFFNEKYKLQEIKSLTIVTESVYVEIVIAGKRKVKVIDLDANKLNLFNKYASDIKIVYKSEQLDNDTLKRLQNVIDSKRNISYGFVTNSKYFLLFEDGKTKFYSKKKYSRLI